MKKVAQSHRVDDSMQSESVKPNPQVDDRPPIICPQFEWMLYQGNLQLFYLSRCWWVKTARR